jgi:hypothetical protein
MSDVIDRLMCDVINMRVLLKDDGFSKSESLLHAFFGTRLETPVYADSVFLRKFLASSIVVAHKLTQRSPCTLDSIAEEVAFVQFVSEGLSLYEQRKNYKGLALDEVRAFDDLIKRFVTNSGVVALYCAGRNRLGAALAVDETALHELTSKPGRWFQKLKRKSLPLPYEPAPLGPPVIHLGGGPPPC